MDPRRWLAVAEESANREDEEWWRDSAGRSYYAFFHVGGLFLERCGFRVPDSDRAYAFVWLRLQNSGVQTLIDIGSELNDLRQFRNIADYRMSARYSQQTAFRCLERATAGIDTLDELIADDALRTRVTEEMRRYEREVLRDVTWRAEE